MRHPHHLTLALLTLCCLLSITVLSTAQDRPTLTATLDDALNQTGIFAPENNTRALNVGLVITETDGSTVATEFGASDTFMVTLTAQPSADITLNFHTVLGAIIEPKITTFTPSNWNIPQTFTVHAIHDYNQTQQTYQVDGRYSLETWENGFYKYDGFLILPRFITIQPTSMAVPTIPLVVTTLDDSISGEVPGSLRQILHIANARAGADTITFDSSLSGTIFLSGDLPASYPDDLTVIGLGQDIITIDGKGVYDGFTFRGVNDFPTGSIIGLMTLQNLTLANMRSAATVYGDFTMTDITVRDSGLGASLVDGYGAVIGYGDTANEIIVNNVTMTGNKGTLGGAITTSSLLTVNNSVFTDNEVYTLSLEFGSRTFAGGAIYLEGFGTINNSTFENNTATDGGALYVDGGIIVVNSTFTGNTAITGGAIKISEYSSPSGPVNFINSTFSNNHAVKGGAVFIRSAFAANSTFSANTASEAGAVSSGYTNASMEFVHVTFSGHNTSISEGIRLFDGGATLIGSIIANNNASDPYECHAGIVGVGLLASDSSCFGTLGVPTGVDPVLRDNGGPTPTHALLAGTNVLGLLYVEGDMNNCKYLKRSLGYVEQPFTDQRGITRANNTCEFGAVEYQADDGLLLNGEFEIAASNPIRAASWAAKGLGAADKRICKVNQPALVSSGNCAFQFWAKTTPINARSIQQTLTQEELGTLVGGQLTFSALVKANKLNKGVIINAVVQYTDGTTSKHRLSVPSGSYAFRPLELTLDLTTSVESIKITLNAKRVLGRVIFDRMSLIEASIVSLPPASNEQTRHGAELTLPPAPDGFRQ